MTWLGIIFFSKISFGRQLCRIGRQYIADGGREQGERWSRHINGRAEDGRALVCPQNGSRDWRSSKGRLVSLIWDVSGPLARALGSSHAAAISCPQCHLEKSGSAISGATCVRMTIVEMHTCRMMSSWDATRKFADNGSALQCAYKHAAAIR
jgi:hypothetical protein